jgi:tetratricopeptide (TPR) repeat protein
MDLIEQGIIAFRAGQKEQAISYFTEAVRQFPNSATAWFWLGKTLDDPEKKKACFDRVLKIDPYFREKLNNEKLKSQTPSPRKDPPAGNIPPDKPVRIGNPKVIILVCAGLVILLVACLWAGMSFLDKSKNPGIAKISSANPAGGTPLVTETQLPPIAPTNTPWPTFTHLPLVSSTVQPAGEITGQSTQVYESLGFQITAARRALDTDQYDECINYYNTLLQKLPNFTSGYQNRSICKNKKAGRSHDLETYNSLLNEAQADVDKAISLGPVKSKYLNERAFVFYHKQLVFENHTSEIAALNIGLDNMQNAVRLGDDPDSSIDMPLFFNELGRCQEGVDLVNQLLEAKPADRNFIVSLYDNLANGYLCLEDYTRAKQVIENLIQMNPNCDAYSTETRILIGLGDLDQAYSVIDKCISGSPSFGGDRYYLRALLHWDRGEKELARQDLTTGSGYTWYHGGLYAYLMGLISLDAGDQAQGIEYLKYAESTVKVSEGPWLKHRIRESLSSLGIPEQSPTPNIMFDATPIVFDQLTPAPPPTQSAPQEEQKPQEPAPAPAVSSQMEGDNQVPTGFEDSIQVDINQGTGPMDLAPGDYPLLHFRPMSAANIRTAKEIHISLSPEALGTPPLQVYLWGKSGGWRMLEPKWGDNLVDHPSFFVGTDGDFYIAIRNYSPDQTIHIENVNLEITAELITGELFTYGKK